MLFLQSVFRTQELHAYPMVPYYNICDIVISIVCIRIITHVHYRTPMVECALSVPGTSMPSPWTQGRVSIRPLTLTILAS